MAIQIPAFDKLLGYQMRRTTSVMTADFVRSLAEFDLRPTEVTTLLIIAANPDCSQSEVGEALAIKRANMVPIIARLIERGLVTRTRVDGRSLALRVTPLGAKCADEAMQRIEEHERRFKDRLSPDALAVVLQALPALRAFGEDADA